MAPTLLIQQGKSGSSLGKFGSLTSTSPLTSAWSARLRKKAAHDCCRQLSCGVILDYYQPCQLTNPVVKSETILAANSTFR